MLKYKNKKDKIVIVESDDGALTVIKEEQEEKECKIESKSTE